MVADGDPSHAAQVCATCKTRKKKCDKVLPSCGYCVRKGLDCTYILRQETHAAPASLHTLRPAQNASFGAVSPGFPLDPVLLEPTIPEADLYQHAHRIIRATGQFVEDISAVYFHGVHRSLPVVSRTRFHKSLINLGATRAADFSALLLSICLITYPPDLARRSGNGGSLPISRKSLHLAAKSLFAQVQVSFSPSVYLIQAGLLLAVYEYVHGQPDDAFATIAVCARMGYAARIHVRSHRPLQPLKTTDRSTEIDIHLQEAEAANTWWGIIIWERIIFCEATCPEQPLITVVPSGDTRLPTEPAVLEQSDALDPESLPSATISSPTTVEVGAFGRAAQAACLLDQVRNSLNTQDINFKLIDLDGLSVALQELLRTLTQNYIDRTGNFCAGIAITIRALFILHWHILEQPPQIINAKFRSQEEWCKRSHATLDSVTKMVVDIADYHETMPSYLADPLSPTCLYILYINRAALRHIYADVQWKDDLLLRAAEERVRASLDRFKRRWSINET